MGEIVGYVSQGVGGPGVIFTSNTSSQSPSTAVGDWHAYGPDLTRMGTRGTKPEARTLVESLQGGQRLLWSEVTDDRGNVREVGRQLAFWPADYGRRNITGCFYRADIGILSGPTSDITDVQQWRSANDTNGVARAVLAVGSTGPTLVQSAISGRPALQFDDAVLSMFQLSFALATGEPNTGLAAGNPNVIQGVGVWVPVSGAPRTQIMVQNNRGLFIEVTAGGNWQVRSGALTLTGPAAVAGEAAVITVNQTPGVGGSTEAFFNGVSFGSGVGVTAAGTWFISDDRGSGWFRDIAEVTIADFRMQPVEQSVLDNYAIKRYLPHLL